MEKGVVTDRIHVGMPGGPAGTALLGRLQRPFRIGGDAAILRGINYFEILLAWLVHQVVLVGRVPPLAHPGGVGPDGAEARRGEGIIPEFRDLGQIVKRHKFKPQVGVADGGRRHGGREMAQEESEENTHMEG